MSNMTRQSLVTATVALLTASGVAKTASAQAIEQIIVTAEKREQRLLDVPVSVSAIGTDELIRKQTFAIEDLTSQVPNLSYAEFGDGQYRIVYRGIGASGTSENQTFSTAIDGVIVPYNRAYRLLDLQRVEVLRGPQGTLYGRNTSAGVINIITEDGRVEPSGYLTGSYGRANTYEVQGAYGGEFGGGGFFRAAGRYHETDGYHRNSVLNLDNVDAGEDYTMRVTGGWSDDDTLLKVSFTRDIYDDLADNNTLLSTPRVSTANRISEGKGDMSLPVLTLEHTFDNVRVTSLTAYTEATRRLAFSAVVSPVFFFQDDEFESFSQELRLASTESAMDGKLDWVFGLYYLDEDNFFRGLTTFAAAQLADQSQLRKTESIAAFGQIDYSLSDEWRVTIGARAQSEKQDSEYQLNRLINSPVLTAAQKVETLLPRFALAFQPDADSQLYASVTRGYRSGFFFVRNPNPIVKPENTWQYEAGYKAALADQRAQIGLAAFYIDWTNLQVQRALGVGQTLVDNAGKARSWGGEIEATFLPSPDWQFSFSAALTNAKYKEFIPTPGVDYSGKFIENAPRGSVSGAVTYRHPSGFEIGADVSYQGKKWLDSANTTAQSGYWLAGAQVAYEWEHFRFAVIGKNLFDEDYISRGVTAPGFPFIGHFADPRSVAVEATVRF